MARLASDERFTAGIHRLEWNGCKDSGARVGIGIYLVRVSAGLRSAARKLVIVSP